MRKELNKIDMKGKIVIGEGEMDKAPMLYNGEELGKGLLDSSLPQVDIAVDPLECTSHCAYNLPNSICVLAVAPRGTLLHAPECYMDKIAGSSALINKISLELSVEENIISSAAILNKPVEELKVIILDRPRNKNKIGTMSNANL